LILFLSPSTFNLRPTSIASSPGNVFHALTTQVENESTDEDASWVIKKELQQNLKYFLYFSKEPFLNYIKLCFIGYSKCEHIIYILGLKRQALLWSLLFSIVHGKSCKSLLKS